MLNNLKPVRDDVSERWVGPPGMKKYQESMQAHYTLNNSKREARTFAIATLAYVFGAGLALWDQTAAVIGAGLLVLWVLRHAVLFYKATASTKTIDAEYARGIREVRLAPLHAPVPVPEPASGDDHEDAPATSA